MIGTIILGGFIIFLIYILLRSRRPKDYPPGPKPLPIVGNVFHVPAGHFYEAIENWAKQYGPIIGLNYFSTLMVCITGVDDVLAALRKEEFQNRPDGFLARNRSFGKLLGVFFSSGEQWQSSRKFVVKHMKAFGKNEREDLIADEISELMEKFKDGLTMQGTGIFSRSAVNVIWKILANKRIDDNDEESKRFLKNVVTVFRQGNPGFSNLVNYFPILRFIDSKFKISHRLVRDTQSMIKKTVQEHKAILDYNNPLDLIDHYLVAMKNNPENPYLSELDLVMIGFDMFSAGAESTSNSVEFVILYMVLHPDVQDKMQQELDQVLGRSRKPVLDDKTKLHYTMAVLNEVERLNSIAPSSVPHSCTKDTYFQGYFIPKDTILSINLYALGHDPKYWENPEEFKPERFLNNEGKYTKSNIFLPFGLGQRICIGEMLARNTIFLFTTTFFEKYSVSLPPGEPKPSTYALPGFTTAPRPFKIHIRSRY